MRTIIHSPEALADIAEELEYLEDRSPAAAIRFAAEIDARIKLLAGQPMMGRARDDLAPGLRSSVVSKFVVLYQFTDAELRIVRVLHGSRNIDQILRGDDADD